MLLVERHFVKGNPEIVRLCTLSKELYNRCNYLIRKAWFSKKKLPNISHLRSFTKDLDCFKNFGNTKTAMQIIRMALIDWSNFIRSLVIYKKDKNKFVRIPKPPKYKEKLAQIIFFKETIRRGMSKKKPKRLIANNDIFNLPYKEGYKQVVVTPKSFGFIIEVQYESNKKQAKVKVSNYKICTIDIGLNNLCAITLDQKRPILINGRIVKSINQWYNKRPCETRLRKRYFRLENYFHHVSKFIVNLCVKHGIGRIIVGKNDGWKQKINLGKKTNQTFCFVPTHLLLEKIKYKAAIASIYVTFTEEAYTSKASFYDNDPLPKYNEVKPEFSGRRKYRGLYITKDKFAINADVNGSLNIGRKVIPEFFGIGDRSLAARPLTINPLKA